MPDDTPPADQLAAGIDALTLDLTALTDRVRTLCEIADHVPATNEDHALALTNAFADIRDLLRRTEEPLQRVTWHAGHLDTSPRAAAPAH